MLKSINEAINCQLSLNTLFDCYCSLIFFPGLFVIIFFYFGYLLWIGVLRLGSYIGFLGLGFPVDGVWGLWCGDLWVFFGLGLSI